MEDPTLFYFRIQLDQTAAKLKKIKGNDFKSLVNLRDKIKMGGNDFANWVSSHKAQTGAQLPDSLIYEFIKALYMCGLTSQKPPRETNRYKFVLYAWIQNDWYEYGPIFANTKFIEPKLQSTQVPTVQSFEEIYSDVHQKLLANKIDLDTAADTLAFTEMKRLNTVKNVCYYEGTAKSLLLSTQVVNKKHKLINFDFASKETMEESKEDKKDEKKEKIPRNSLWFEPIPDPSDGLFTFWKNPITENPGEF